jgi:hypothetical protein
LCRFSHRGNPGSGTPQPPPEGFQGLDALAVADEDDRPRQEIQDHREIVVALADRDFVDGDLLEFVQLGLAEATSQGARLDVFDGIPTDLKVFGRVLDGHVPGQLQGVAFKRPRVPFLGIGEGELDLQHPAASEAVHPRHLELEQHRLAADRHGAEGPLDTALCPDVGAAAVRTA